MPEPGEALAHGVELVGVAPLASTPTVVAWLWAISAVAMSATWTTSSGERPNALTTSSTGAPRLAATRALKVSSVGPATSV